MTKLLKANFYKLIKEKSSYILVGISMATALIAIVLYHFLGAASQVGANVQVMVNAETLFLSGIKLGQNVGIIIALGVTLFIGKEFSQNTIRNKITIGYSKNKIYLSNLIMSFAISGLIYFAFQIIIFSVALPLFGWNDGFVFAHFVRQLINSLCILISFAAVLNLISMLSRSLVASILISLVGMVLGVFAFAAINAFPLDGSAEKIVDVLTKSNFLGQSLLIASVNSVSFMIWCIVSAVITTVGSAALGCFLFEKMDVK